MHLLKNNPWFALGWSAVIFYLLSMDTSSAGEYSILKVYGIDKLIHFGIFVVFGWLWGIWSNHKFANAESVLILLIILAGSIFGMGMEYYQKFFTKRTFSYWDGLADALGAVVGVWYSIKKPLWK
ncbi:MAG: hypothetical protein RLZZ595_93 [Bacteroidota bacterium]|jgi:VanZ family protein